MDALKQAQCELATSVAGSTIVGYKKNYLRRCWCAAGQCVGVPTTENSILLFFRALLLLLRRLFLARLS
jgi:hypothetical protein